MLEEYILTTDGEKYVDVNSVREALGIKDDENIFLAIKKLKDKINGIKAELELTNNLYKENRDFVDKVCEAVDIQRPYIESDYDNAVKLIAGFKRERDKLKKRANATYGISCGYSEYSGDKAPAFLCNVISYSWEFSPINACTLGCGPSYRVRDDSIRVELSLTPTANYKGTFDLEDLKKYIQDYGREKKLGVVESVDYQNAKTARAELAYLYKRVLGKERLDTDLSPHEVMKAILDEYRRVRIEKLPELVNDHIDELCDKYNVVQPDRKSTTKERIDYIFGVLAEQRDLANGNFNKAEGFRQEKRIIADSLAELRAKVREIYCSVVDDEWDEYLAYTSALNDINEEYKRVVHNFEERTADWSKERQELDRYRLAVGSLCNIPAEHRDDISWIEDAFNNTKKDYLKWQTQADKLSRLRSNICTALCLGGETSDEDILNAITKARKKCNDLIVFRNDVAKAIGLAYIDINSDIINRVMDIKECHDKLCKDYTELRKAIWDAMDRKPETLPNETARLVGEVRMLQSNYAGLKRLHDEVAKAIDMNYPATDNVILNNVQYICRDREDAYKIVSKLNDHITELEKAKKDLQKDYDELGEAYSSVLKWNNSYAEVRRLLGVSADADADEMVDTLDQLVCERERCKRRYENWYSRYESEHERANGEHKRAEKLRSDVTALKNHIELLRNANDSRANALVSLQAFKNECRKLKDEKAKVISALGQDIWDDCLK